MIQTFNSYFNSTDVPYYWRSLTTNFCLGNALSYLRDITTESVKLVVTSPPYNLKGTGGGKWSARFGKKGIQDYNYRFREGYASYGDNMPDNEYIAWQQEILRECWRILRPDGVIFYNHKHISRDKRLIKGDRCIPEELIDYLRQEIVWNRFGSPNWNTSYFLPKTERIYLIAKRDWKILDPQAVLWGDVWNIAPVRKAEHPCPFPEELAERCIRSGSSVGDLVVDPFCGSGTTNYVAQKMQRISIGIDIEEKYLAIAITRMFKL
jgi:site-specific DNA-methyltransferase (adenine-specific)